MLFVRNDTPPGTSLGVVSSCWQGQAKALRTFLPTRMDLQLFFCGKDVAEDN